MIEVAERRALSELSRLDWAPTQEDVWSPLDIHIDELNGDVGKVLLRAFEEAENSRARCPLGLVIEGRQGAGKTHLVRWAREQVQRRHGYFFLMGVADGRSFWTNIVHAFLRGLRRSGSYRHLQLSVLLGALAEIAQVTNATRLMVRGDQPITPEALDQLAAGVRRAYPEAGRDCRHTLRALVLVASPDENVADAAESWLLSADDGTVESLEKWGIPRSLKKPQDVAEEISRLLAITGPTMLAVDQIDTIFAQARTSAGEPVDLAADLGNGLMQLREALSRTVTIVACLPTSWNLIKQSATDSVTNRFRQETRLSVLPSPEVAESLLAAKFEPFFETAEFVPPYPTWPIRPEAFRTAADITPRQLLQRADDHVESCLDNDVVVHLTDLGSVARPAQRIAPDTPPEHLTKFDERLSELREQSKVGAALNPGTEDQVMPRLLDAGLRAWTIEQGDRRSRYKVQPGEDGSPSLHAWLRETLDDTTEDEAQWSFRALAHPHHRAVQTRLRRLRDFANLDPAIHKRRAVLLRNIDWPSGAVSRRVRQEFLDLGGIITDVSEDDLRTFDALATMLDEHEPALPHWLVSRQPAWNTTLLTAIFGPPSAGTPPLESTPEHDDEPAAEHEIGLGRADGKPVRATLESLRKHAVIFAGSGSGKTVLIRRLIEECAIHGVSSIVLDPNNDLARLGDPWPAPPPEWRPEDARMAADYLDGTDVVVWTPRREAGRPLSLQPLPDFAAVLDEPDEFALALDAAVAALAPRARMAANTAKADRGRAVLRQAMAHFGRLGGGGLSDFVDLLKDLPHEAATLAKAYELAADMAETLQAAMVNDPLFGGAGVPLDPGVLMTPAPGKRARISVVNFIGLPTDEQRQSFVNQLQMALFAWIKRHPAGDRPLGGLFVMDEAQTLVPSGSATACTESALALASQARKYGLGLIFATQAPRGIHNRIVGNAATQFYGFLNSPTQIAAAKEVAQAKGSAVLEISRLKAGEFYAVAEGKPFRRLSTPMCLSYHPKSALTAEEVLQRARAEHGRNPTDGS
ncbi:DUF87 domain-containing protein [Paractinoplanes ferrugineus]|uniref:ATPase n=1 Tax=Paractinoplanes ferrugineus TaxID=113564 RepID=A0A919MAW0_9ACTN|nr:DUF87 domain-containing protein [Actinoplanes ferrugineus]GIE13006.1 ATPase [Actinoplanes ferrugineus]